MLDENVLIEQAVADGLKIIGLAVDTTAHLLPALPEEQPLQAPEPADFRVVIGNSSR